MGMLVSVLVDRYQRVYNRKMYIPEPEIETVDFDDLGNSDEEPYSVFSLPKSSIVRQFSRTISHSLGPLKTRREHATRQASTMPQPYKLQFLVSFNDLAHDKNAADEIVTVMKTKLTEVLSDTEVDLDLKLINHDNQELWTISSLSSSSFSSDSTAQTNIDELPLSTIEIL